MRKPVFRCLRFKKWDSGRSTKTCRFQEWSNIEENSTALSPKDMCFSNLVQNQKMRSSQTNRSKNEVFKKDTTGMLPVG